jgi:tRNA pseudouridine55 synthase
MHGVLLVDKPKGMSSHDVVNSVRRLVRPFKVGHTGTLDPAASGLVVILIGAATKALDYLDETRKTYILSIRLGEETDSGDRDGVVLRTADPSGISRDRFQDLLATYVGVRDQIPPHFSAIKRDGVPLYKLARKGVFPELEPRKVEMYSLELSGWKLPLAEVHLICSKGTYARALARDLGNDLGVGARLDDLRRTASGPFCIDDALSVAEIGRRGKDAIINRLIPLTKALSNVPDLTLFPMELARLIRGTGVSVPRSRFGSHLNDGSSSRFFKIASADGRVLILLRPDPKGTEIALQPVRVLQMFEDT